MILFKSTVMAFVGIAISAGVLAVQQQVKNLHLLSPEEQKLIQNAGHEGKNQAGSVGIDILLFVWLYSLLDFKFSRKSALRWEQFQLSKAVVNILLFLAVVNIYNPNDIS